MATIRKRGEHQWQVIIRRKGYPKQSATFETRNDAEKWALSIEGDMVRGAYVDRTEAERTTLAEALQRYLRENTVRKRGAQQETDRIRTWLQHPLAKRTLAGLRSMDFARYRDDRLNEVSAATVRLELAIISHLFTQARKEWGLPLENPIANIRKPTLPPGRDRRLLDGEEQRLLHACREHSLWLEAIVKLAIATGMRAGELVALNWRQVYLADRTITLEMTKNGSRRMVPLSKIAADALQSLPRQPDGKVFKFEKSKDLSKVFARVCKRAGIENLRFHDLRHEAASRLAPHLTVQTLAKVMGWKTLQMAMRYYNPTRTELLAAVDAAAANREDA